MLWYYLSRWSLKKKLKLSNFSSYEFCSFRKLVYIEIYKKLFYFYVTFINNCIYFPSGLGVVSPNASFASMVNVFGLAGIVGESFEKFGIQRCFYSIYYMHDGFLPIGGKPLFWGSEEDFLPCSHMFKDGKVLIPLIMGKLNLIGYSICSSFFTLVTHHHMWYKSYKSQLSEH